MNIDIRTLIIILGITRIFQVFAFLLQYYVNKTYGGIGWWALGNALVAVGFSLLLLRDVVSLALISIIIPNALFVLGIIFMYSGARRFFGKKVHGGVVLSIFAAFLLCFLYYTYVNNDITARTTIMSATFAIFAFMIAHCLFENRTRSISASVYFTSAVFFASGCHSIFRALATPTISPVSSLFTPSLMQASGFVVPFIVGISTTFGLIIMVNQRLNADMKEAKEKFEAIFNTNPDASAITRLHDGVIVDVNERFTELFGLSRNEIIGKTSFDFGFWVNPSDRQKVIDELEDKGYCRNYEAIFHIGAGNQITGIMSAKIISLMDIPHVISVTHDITERKRAEEALRQSEKGYRLISENTADVIWVLDVASQRIKYVSPSVQKLRGYTPEEIMGQPSSTVLTPESAKRVSELLAVRIPQFLSGAPMPLSFTDEVDQPCKDGSIVHTEVTTSFLLNEQAQMEIVGVSRDVTERKRAEEERRATEAKFRCLFETNVIPIAYCHTDGRVLDANDVYLELIGFTREELAAGEARWDVVTPPEWKHMDEAGLRCLRQDGVCPPLEKEYLRRDGTRVPVLLGACQVPGDSEQVVAFAMDLTERKAMEEEVRKSRDELEERVQERTAELERRNQELHEFAFVASHDLNEPLRKIQTFGSLLALKSADRLNEQCRDYVSRMTGAANRMQELLEALLRYSRVDTKGQEFGPVKLYEIAKDAASDLEVTVRNLEAHVEIEPLPTVNGDPQQLRQLFQNLFTNALKYHRAGVKPVIKVYGETDNGKGRIFVEDKGIGFEEKYLDKIFKPFQRLHGRDEYPGLGIGLAICRKIVERHGGTITACSTPGKGSTFIVTLQLLTEPKR